MKVYRKSDDYLVSYDIKNDQIIQHYYKDKKEYSIPNIPHNVELCDSKLASQFNEITTADIENIKTDRNIAITNLVIPDLYVLYLSISIHPFFLTFLVPLVLIDLKRIISKTKTIKHFELTNFCLEHATEIKEIIQSSDYTLKLSKSAQQALIVDQEFTLNHSDRYHVSDLKQFQKAIGSK